MRIVLFACVLGLWACSSGSSEETASGGKKKAKNSEDVTEPADDGEAESDSAQGGDAQGETPTDRVDGEGAKSSCGTFKDGYSSHATANGKASVPILGSIAFSVDADAKVTVASTATGGSLAIDGRVTKANPALAKSTAERGLGAYGDPMKMAYADAGAIAGESEWKDLECVVTAAKTLKSKSFDYEFEPALPVLVDPSAKSGSLQRSVPVKATLKRHFEEKNGAKAGTYEGVAKISQSGNKIKITYDFGGGTPNIFAAPFQAIEYTLDGSGKYSSITAWLWISATDTIPVVIPR